MTLQKITFIAVAFAVLPLANPPASWAASPPKDVNVVNSPGVQVLNDPTSPIPVEDLSSVPLQTSIKFGINPNSYIQEMVHPMVPEGKMLVVDHAEMGLAAGPQVSRAYLFQWCTPDDGTSPYAGARWWLKKADVFDIDRTVGIHDGSIMVPSGCELGFYLSATDDRYAAGEDGIVHSGELAVTGYLVNAAD